MNTLAAYLSAVFGITLIAVGGVVALEILRPEGVNSQATYTILGICTPTLAVLIGLVKSISNGQAAEAAAIEATKARQEVARNTVITAQAAATTTAIAEAAAVPLPPPHVVRDVLEKSLPRPNCPP